MTILRQIKDLKTEFATIHSHVLRRLVQINGGIPLALDPKKPLRRTLLPGWLIIGGLPPMPSYGPDAGHDTPDGCEADMEDENAIA
jgi:hypothetical protein